MPLHLVGIGLADEQDITLKGLDAIRKCSEVYLEAYTSVLTVPKERLEAAWGVTITIADRDFVESKIEPVLERAATADIALLIVGDPFGATTHCDLLARARQLRVPTNVVHNASIMNAIGCCGLQLYRFGETISIPFFTSTWRPSSYFDKLRDNLALGLHTLALVDIKVKEPTLSSLARGRRDYLPPRFMTIRQAVQQLLELDAEYAAKNSTAPLLGPDARAIGVARVGCADQIAVAGTLSQLLAVQFGPPLHSLVIVGRTHDVEDDLVDAFCVKATEAASHSDAELAAIDAAADAAGAAHEGIELLPDADDVDETLASEEPSMFAQGGSNAEPGLVVEEGEGAPLDDLLDVLGIDEPPDPSPS